MVIVLSQLKGYLYFYNSHFNVKIIRKDYNVAIFCCFSIFNAPVQEPKRFVLGLVSHRDFK